MKFIFLIVLLANIIFFLWEYNAPSPHFAQSVNTQSKQKLKNIFFLSEVEKKTEKEALSQANTPVKLVPSKTTFCYEVGPFQDKKELDQWFASNKNTISNFRQIEKSITKNPRYLVYSPATGNIEQSEANIQKFQKMGINDVWLFRKGELEGTISFGLFSKENGALDLQNKLSAKGLDAKILHTNMTKSLLYLQIFTEKEWLKSIFNTNNKQVLAECENG